MGWDGTTLRYPFTKIKNGGLGDLEQALSMTAPDKSHIKLFEASFSTLNKLSFWKPFRSSTVAFATPAARKAANIASGCGFGTITTSTSATLPTYTPGTGGGSLPHAEWEYQPPRGGSYNEPYRAMDFAPGIVDSLDVGYYKNAVSPIYVMWPASITTGNGATVTIRFDGSGNTEYWRQGLCLSVANLFPTNSVYYSQYRFALIFKGSSSTVIAVSKNTMQQAITSQSDSITVPYSNIQTVVPSIGSSCTAAICLIQATNGSSTSVTYLTNYTGVVTSLEIDSNCDRTTLTYIGEGSIAGISGTLTVTMGTKVSYTATGFSCYYPVAKISFTLSRGSSWGSRTTVGLQLTMTSTMTMGNSSGPGASPQVINFAVQLTSSDTNKSFTDYFVYGTNGFDSRAYVGSSANATFTAKLEAVNGSQIIQIGNTYSTTLTR